jgi:uncharacterized protein (TIGR03437 family)
VGTPNNTLWGLILAIAICVLPAEATDTPLTLNLSGSAPGGEQFSPASATGTVSPFGQAQASLQSTRSGNTVNILYTFDFGNGNSFAGKLLVTVTPSPGRTEIDSFTGEISGGTGIFSQASGSLTGAFSLPSEATTTQDYTITGSGTITTQDTGGALTALPQPLTFRVAPDASSTATQGLMLKNLGLSAVAFQANNSGSSWLSVSPASGSVPALSTLLLNVTVNIEGLKAGIYNGQVTVTDPAGSILIAVQLVLGPLGPNLQLSDSGLNFVTTSGGPAPPAVTVTVSNIGTGSLAGLTATASVMSTAERKWLTATVLPSPDPQRIQVSITADTTGLLLEKYYGRVDFSTTGAVNSPQSVIVVMDVYQAPYDFDARADNVGFGYSPPSPVTGPNHLTIYNLGKRPINFSTEIVNYRQSFVGGRVSGWLTVSPTSGVLNAGAPVTLTVSVAPLNFPPPPPGTPNATVGLAADVIVKVTALNYSADTTLTFGYDVRSDFSTPGVLTRYARAATVGQCADTQLFPLFASIGDGFQATVARPTSLEVQVGDACLQPVNTGSLVVTFSSGDPPLPLTSIGGGRWSATWVPRTAAANVAMTVQSQTARAAGTWTLNGSVAANTDTPLLDAGGVGSAANGVTTIAPGEFITIYGSNLRTGAPASPTSAPYPDSLAGTQVTLAGLVLPLAYSGTGQINAIVPYDLPPNTIQQIVVQSGAALSQPEMVTIGAAKPSVFTQDQSGSGPGAILVQKAGTSVSTLVTASNPASAGDALLIFCTGLGTVSPTVAAGASTPAAPLSKTDNQVTVKVGGQNATVLFAGLAPGFVGLYQVNVTVPAGIAAASNVPLIMTAAETDSTPVTVAIK